jgi:hypothetical protein
MRQLFVVGDEMRNVNIAVVLLYKNIFSYLISVRRSVNLIEGVGGGIPVDKNVVEVKLHYKVNERLLNP